MEATFDLRNARELDARSNDGIEVRLLWDPPTNCVGVEVVDSRSGERFALAVDAADAIDAFHHPFGYAARSDAVCASPAAFAAKIDQEGPLSLRDQRSGRR
jgi:hypothetical protein